MTFQEELLSLVPQLLGYARGMVRIRADADDLVQDVVMRAWAAQDRYEPGTNMRAWLFTILRNRFYNKYTGNARAEVPIDEVAEAALSILPAQEWHVQQTELRAALERLHPALREALLLSLGAELSYQEIGEIVGSPVGTVKSRVFRARQTLAAMLDGRQDLPATA